MIAPGTAVSRPAVVAWATSRRGPAFVEALAESCRAWPELRDWLCEEFGRSARTRANFRALIDAAPADRAAASRGLAALAGETTAWERERARLQDGGGADLGRFGGRTWREMEQLVCRYEAGNIDLGAFVLVRQWRKKGARARHSPELQRAAAEFMDAIIRDGQTRLVANLARALALYRRTTRANLRANLGHADWWKLHALLFMLRHPRASYRTRDVRAHLESLGLRISSLDFRRLCKRHGIRRDERPGRPRTRTASDQ